MSGRSQATKSPCSAWLAAAASRHAERHSLRRDTESIRAAFRTAFSPGRGFRLLSNRAVLRNAGFVCETTTRLLHALRHPFKDWRERDGAFCWNQHWPERRRFAQRPQVPVLRRER